MKEMYSFSDKFEEYLNSLLAIEDKDYDILIKSMRYSLLGGGKRVRPFLLVEFFKACGGEEKLAYNFAAAIEMIHTYSLIHDDLPCMDDDDFRRGKLSNHKKFGDDIALLAGDSLLTEAFYVASLTKGVNAEYVNEALKVLAFCAGTRGMVGGQVIDLQSEGKKVDAKTIEKLNLLKTGALLKAACQIGCILAGADKEKQLAAVKFGENIGLAFQLVDDVLDTTADSATLGKPVGSDEKNDKSTFASIYGINYCKQKANEYTNEAIDLLNVFDGNTDVLKDIALYLLERNF